MVAIVLASLAMAALLMGAAIMNSPWLIVVLFLFLKLAWPKKRKVQSSLDEDCDYE